MVTLCCYEGERLVDVIQGELAELRQGELRVEWVIHSLFSLLIKARFMRSIRTFMIIHELPERHIKFHHSNPPQPQTQCPKNTSYIIHRLIHVPSSPLASPGA